jgi:hypothetical protein
MSKSFLKELEQVQNMSSLQELILCIRGKFFTGEGGDYLKIRNGIIDNTKLRKLISGNANLQEIEESCRRFFDGVTKERRHSFEDCKSYVLGHMPSFLKQLGEKYVVYRVPFPKEEGLKILLGEEKVGFDVLNLQEGTFGFEVLHSTAICEKPTAVEQIMVETGR